MNIDEKSNLNAELNHGQEHDHVERDVVRISPSVLDCKLHELEKYASAKSNIIQDIGLVVTIFVVLASGGVNDFLGLPQSTINGAFTVGLVVMIGKTVVDFARVIVHQSTASRAALMRFLKKEPQKSNWWKTLSLWPNK